MKQTKKFLKYMPTFVFCLVLFIIPVLYLCIADSDFSALEKRKLSRFPTPTVETVFSGEFGKAFETYLNDQMPLRTFFVGTNAYYDQISGRNGMNGIYKAKDNYLMVTPIEETSTLDNNLRFLGEFIESSNVPNYVCIVPTSGYIYNDKLPLNHAEYKDDKIIDKVQKNIESVPNGNVINITDKFKELSSQEQLYYKTDHHWTATGAYECYKILGEKMNFTPTPKTSFKVESYDNFYGTNYAKSALWFTPSESIELWVNQDRPSNSVKLYINEGGELTVSNDLFFRENLKTSDQYTAYLDGNHGIVTIKNDNSSSDKRLLILRDSYSHCLAPFLADNYSEIVLADVRYYLSPVSEILKKENIDEVLIIYSLDSIVNSTDIAGIY